MLLILLIYLILFLILFYCLKQYKTVSDIIVEALSVRGLLTIFSGILIANFFVIGFVSREKFIYFWDYTAYWDMSVTSATFIKHTPFNMAFSHLIDSINHDSYNIFATYLIFPFLKVLGTSRVAYVLSVLNLFFIPSVFLLSLICKQVTQIVFSSKSLRFDFIFILLLLFPPIITPMLRGYLDIVGLIPACLILLILLNEDFKEIKILNALMLSFLIIIELFTRRWYAFFIASLCISYGCVYIFRVLISKERGLKVVAKVFSNWLIIGVSTLLILWIFFRPFLQMSGGVDYAYIYSAYRFGTLSNEILSLVWYVGVFASMLIGLGVYKAFRYWFPFVLILQSPIQFYLFWRVESFGQQHYYLFMPFIVLFLILGINAIILLHKKLYYPALGVIFMVSFIQFSNSFIQPFFAPSSRFVLSNSILYPNKRDDVEQIKNLTSYLHSLSGDIYVMASSNVTFNDDILRHVDMPNTTNAIPNLLPTNNVDLSDGFPYQFMGAKYIVVADPIQLHLGKNNQMVVWFFANNILAQSSFGQNYKLLKVFSIDKNIKINVYEKEKCFTGEQLEDITNSFKNYYPNDGRFNNLQLGKFGCQNEK